MDAPFNLLSMLKLTDIESLNKLGVKRFSLDNSLSDAITAFIEKQAVQLLTNKNIDSLYGGLKVKTKLDQEAHC